MSGFYSKFKAANSKWIIPLKELVLFCFILSVLVAKPIFAKKTAKPLPPVKLVEALPRPFPEESFRSLWDRGCSDWKPVTPMISGISISTERKNGMYRILAEAKVDLQPGQNLEKVYQSASEVLSDGLQYPTWVMPGINTDPEGNPYFVKLESAAAERHLNFFHEYIIHGFYSLNVLWLKREGQASIVLKDEISTLPNCLDVFEVSMPQAVTRVMYRMTPKEGILDYMIGEAFVVQRKDHVQLKMRAVLKPANALYQLIPEKMVSSQVDQRGRKIFENFLKQCSEKSIR